MAIGSFSLPISSSSEEWTRPTDWLPMPTGITSANQTFVALHAVFESGQNYCAFSFTTSAGQYQVDWGDGTVTLHNSNTIAQKDFDYALISNLTLTNRGYKQSMITVTAVSGNLLTCNFQRRFVTSPVQNQSYSTGFLECILSMPNASVGFSVSFGGTLVNHSFVERFDVKNIGNCTNISSFFQNCFSLQSIPLFDTSNVTTMVTFFSGCFSLITVPLFNTQNVTNMLTFFSGCSSLQSIPLFDTSNVTGMQSTFANCSNIKSIPLFNTQNVTNMASMFNNCLSLKYIPSLSTVSITSASGVDFSAFGSGLFSLNKCEMIFARTISFQNCQLSRIALIEIFTNLVNRSSTTSATITITGNWGATALTAADRLIATNKNWVIVG